MDMMTDLTILETFQFIIASLIGTTIIVLIFYALYVIGLLIKEELKELIKRIKKNKS
jgi:hypothetical protein